MAQQTLQTFTKAIPYTKSDTVALPQWYGRYPDAIWVGGAGIVACIFPDASEVDMTVGAGTLLPISGLLRINSSTTTATLFVALWQI